MKIVHVESGRHLYGGARQVACLIDGLGKLGVRSVLMCRPDAAIGQQAVACEVVELPMHGDLDFGLIGRLRRAIRRVSPDVVHVHSRGGADYWAGIAARRESRPAVLTRRVDSHEPTLLATAKYARYDAVAAISTAVREQVIGTGRVDERKVEYIPSAVDPVRYAPNERVRRAARHALNVRDGEFLIGAVGQLIPRKGHETLIAAMPAVLAQHRHARMLIFGKGPLQRRLQQHIEQLQLGNRARLVGFEAPMSKQLPALDLFVHPARREGLGLAVLEALSCGLPVVARRVGGLSDLITDGDNGMLITDDRPNGFADAIGGLIADPDRCLRFAERGRARVLAQFTVEAMSSRYLDVYDALLAGRYHGK